MVQISRKWLGVAAGTVVAVAAGMSARGLFAPDPAEAFAESEIPLADPDNLTFMTPFNPAHGDLKERRARVARLAGDPEMPLENAFELAEKVAIYSNSDEKYDHPLVIISGRDGVFWGPDGKPYIIPAGRFEASKEGPDGRFSCSLKPVTPQEYC